MVVANLRKEADLDKCLVLFGSAKSHLLHFCSVMVSLFAGAEDAENSAGQISELQKSQRVKSDYWVEFLSTVSRFLAGCKHGNFCSRFAFCALSPSSC